MTSTLELLDAKPPCDIDAERGVLASVMLKPELLPQVMEELPSANYFYHVGHQALYGVMRKLAREGKAFDTTILVSELRLSGQYDSIGGTAGLVALYDSHPTAAHWPVYAERVSEQWKRRRARQVGEQLIQGAHNGVATDVLVNDAISDLSQDAAIGTAKAGITYQGYTCAELATMDFTTRYVIRGVYEKLAPMVVGAPKKTGKTNIMCDFSLSIATGSPFLGHFDVLERLNVGFSSGESGPATIVETLKRICDAKELAFEQVEGLVVTTDLPKITDPAHLRAVEQFVKQHKLGVFIVDPFYLTIGGDVDTASLFAMGEHLRNMNAVCVAENCGLIMVHHLKKPAPNEAYQIPDLGDLAHAGISEWMRQWMVWRPRAQYVGGSGYFPLGVQVGGSSGHSGTYAVDINEGRYHPDVPRVWQVTVTTMGDARDAEQERRDEEKQQHLAKRIEASMAAIVRAMNTPALKAGATKTKIRDSTTLNTKDFNPAFERLVDTLQVESVDVFVSNQKTPKAGWKLAGTTQC